MIIGMKYEEVVAALIRGKEGRRLVTNKDEKGEQETNLAHVGEELFEVVEI